MTDLDASTHLDAAPNIAAPLPGGGRPVRKDETDLLDRGVHIESWLPERRSRRKPLVLVHGELGGSWVWERFMGYFAGRGWEAHAVNLRNHHLSQSADPASLSFDTYLEDVLAAVARHGENAVLVGHGMGGLLALKAAERQRVAALVLLSPEPPRELRPAARPHEVRSIPEAYGKARLGWDTLPEKLLRDHRDLSLPDILRIQHLLGQKPREAGAARRQVIAGVPVDRTALAAIPALVVGAGLDRYVPEATSEALAEWLGAAYEPFGAHSHFGLVLGETAFVQVADAVRSFLESNRL